MKEVTVRHRRPAYYTADFGDPQESLEAPALEFELTYNDGSEQSALRALDDAYADLRQQITGMATIVHGKQESD